MDCFEVLEIEPTKDVKKIKRAYSKLLPLHPPETDADGFQQLTTAYKEALKKASEEDIPLQEAPLSPVDKFMLEFEENYKDFKRRINPNSWHSLLEQDICINIDTESEISRRILTFIMDNYNFPHEIWKVFDSYFSWNSQTEKLYSEFPNNFIDFVVYELNNKEPFSYEALLNCVKGKEDEFIATYNLAYKSLNNYDLYNCKKSIDTLKELCPEHPDLFILDARYLVTNGNIPAATSLYNTIIESGENIFDALLFRAQMFFRICQYADAYNDLKKVLEIEPYNINSLYDITRCCISLEKFDEAVIYAEKLIEKEQYSQDVYPLLNSAYNFSIESLNKSLEADPNDATLNYKLAKAYYVIRKFEECHNLLSNIQQKNLEFTADMYLLLCQVLNEFGKTELTYSTANTALEIYPENYELTLFFANFLDDLKNYDEALEFYDKAIKLNSKDALPHNNKANILNILHRYEDALEEIDIAISLDPKMAHCYKNKANTLLGLNSFEACMEACEKSLSLFPYLTESYVIKMKLFIKVDQFDEGLTVFNKALELGLEDSRLYKEKATILYSTEKYDDAIIFCDRALALDQNNADAYYYKGLSYYAMEKFTDAIDCFDKALEINNNYSAAYYYKAYSLKLSSKLDEALLVIDDAIKLNCDYLDRFYALKGDILSDTENDEIAYEDAITEYKRALETDPNNESLHYSIGLSLNDLHKYKDAIAYFDKVIELNPSSKRAYIDKSYSLYKLKEYPKCIEECKKALEIDSNYLIAIQNTAWSYYELNDLEQAEFHCNNGLKIDPTYKNLLFLKITLLKAKESYMDALTTTNRYLELDPTDTEVMEIKADLIKRIDDSNKLVNKFLNKFIKK